MNIAECTYESLVIQIPWQQCFCSTLGLFQANP